MELWIRSQDRESLMLCKRLSIIDKDVRDDGTDSYVINADNGAWDYDIGLYKTKERSLEVLDEIQNMIKPTLINTEYHSEIKQNVDKFSFDVVMTPIEDKITYIQPNVVIYEMPKE